MIRILVVEDDKLLLDTLKFDLESEGFEIIPISSYEDGMNSINNNFFDLAILDINLPDGDGFNICKEIKSISNIPVIFLTARDLEDDEIKGFDLGADDYITKPFSLKLLKKRINAILKRVGLHSNQSNYDDGFLSVNFDTLKVSVLDKEHNLTPTEFNLLIFFIESKGVILTRDFLLERLWDQNLKFVNDHALSVQINRLRSKIEYEEHKYIKTIYGVGYQWIGQWWGDYLIFLAILFGLLALILFIKLYYNEKEINRFVKFHKKASETIISDKRNSNYPFFKDDRLNRMENNLRALEKYINDEKNKINEDKHSLQTIISDISHQVKTPMANIKMLNEILLSKKLDENQSKEFINSMNKEIDKLNFLMQSMITISLLETGIMKFNTRVLPIYNTILSSLNSTMSLINEKDIDIKVICNKDILVKHDPKWTSEAIYNVINNAAKFSPPKGIIVVVASQGQFYSSISIKDNGAGISEGNMKDIFKKFYSKNNKNGSGIGLHLTERIIKGQNGYINVNSDIGKGTEFILHLPNE